MSDQTGWENVSAWLAAHVRDPYTSPGLTWLGDCRRGRPRGRAWLGTGVCWGLNMRIRLGFAAKCAGLLLTGGFLMAGIGTTCSSFVTETAFEASNTSFIFDCDTAFGGVFELESLLLDCSQTTGP